MPGPKSSFSTRASMIALAIFASLFFALPILAQDPAPAPAPASPTPATLPTKPAEAAPAEVAAPASASVWTVGGIDFSGLVDGYYNFNANHPPVSSNGNQLRNFDFDANAFSLNMAKITMAHDADPVGFRVDLGFGKAFDFILASEPHFAHLEQAFVSFKPKNGRGFEVDFGEFVTSAGAEVIETKDNWNYSRSLLFSYAIPYYHVGLRTSMPVTKALTAGVQLVNGWNNFSDNNSGKTVGFTGVYTKTKYTLSGNYYVGPENNQTNVGKRNLFDTTLLLTPTSKLNAYINYDYGQNRDARATSSTQFVTSGLERWQGIAAALHYQFTPTLALAPRFEYYQDATGFTTGTQQNLNEFTLTGEYKRPEGLLFRVEYRRDNSNQQYFVKGSRLVNAQSTLEAGVVAFFGPKR